MVTGFKKRLGVIFVENHDFGAFFRVRHFWPVVCPWNFEISKVSNFVKMDKNLQKLSKCREGL